MNGALQRWLTRSKSAFLGRDPQENPFMLPVSLAITISEKSVQGIVMHCQCYV